MCEEITPADWTNLIISRVEKHIMQWLWQLNPAHRYYLFLLQGQWLILLAEKKID